MTLRLPFLRFTALALLLMSAPAHAQNPEDIGWSGDIEANGSVTTGNNETTNAGVRFVLRNRGYDWRHDLGVSADYGEADGSTNKRRWRASYKIGRDISERSFLFANTDHYSDDFGAFKNGTFVGAGYGYDVLIDGPLLWDVEIGAGYRSQKARLTQTVPTDPITRTESFASARLSSDLDYQLNENVLLTNDTELFYSDADTYIINEIALTSELFSQIALRASFRIESHTDVPEGREKTDTISRIGIVYTMD